MFVHKYCQHLIKYDINHTCFFVEKTTHIVVVVKRTIQLVKGINKRSIILYFALKTALFCLKDQLKSSLFFLFSSFMISLKTGHYAKIGLALWTMVFSFTPQDTAVDIRCIPAEITS